MLSSTLVAIVLVSTVTAITPPDVQPASTTNLTVAFGNTLGLNGVDLPRDVTASAPSLGTAQKLSGTYAILMADLDIPPAALGGPTGELLHWLQTGLESANTSTTIAGTKVFQLVIPANIPPVQTYRQPSPPNKSPVSHRYTQFLLNTTGNNGALASLKQAGAATKNFTAAGVIKNAGANVVAGNWFNVTNANATGANGPSGSNSTVPVATSPVAASEAVGMTSGGRAMLAGVCVLAAAVAIL